MRVELKWLTLAIALIVVAGAASGVWMWSAGQAKAEGTAQDLSAQKTDPAKAPVVKADDDDDENEADDDDDDGDDEDGEDGEDEVKVTLDQVPDAVKAAILAEAKGNPIKEIEKETEHGQTTYEAEWIVDGKEIELKVSDDGKVLKRKVEDADDDDDK